MEQMGQLLPRNAKGHLCNSRRSEEIFRGKRGRGPGAEWICLYCLNCTKFGLLILRKIIKIITTRSHKAIMHQIRFRLGLCPRPRWGSSQRSPRPLSWILVVLLLRGGRGREKGRGSEGRGRGGKGREGKTLWVCSPRKNFLATPLNCHDPNAVGL